MAEVSNAAESQGLATSLAAGSTTIEARDPATGITATSTVTVTAVVTVP